MSASPALPTTVDRILVEFPATEGYRSVGRLVLGGLASRFELPVDRVEDLLLAVESLLLREFAGDTVTLEVEASPEGLRVRLGPFAEAGIDAAVARVLDRLVDGVTADGAGERARVELVVTAARLRGG